MRGAFDLDQVHEKQPAKKLNPFSTYTIVELSVRENGVKLFRFEHRSNSISTLIAQPDAEKAARDKGYEVWIALDIRLV
ncbi:conserved hypothetical protein [Pseudomonas sp. 9AZ]|uniref:hypothetical protein n=1 Tax=Pseudomonas sp. 9AZ TaxID=2653168 RepID=UPI0012F3938A|nr:hypothetical protein [Pseudomonas sp. 9AZ]VXC96716.1 conserved hypothetical protein [Pseudomonas sp. 9AZ]